MAYAPVAMASTFRDLLALETAIQSQKLMRHQTHHEIYSRTMLSGVKWILTANLRAALRFRLS
jgi:hypothetical protein